MSEFRLPSCCSPIWVRWSMVSVLRAHDQNISSKQVGKHGGEKPGRAGADSQPRPHILPPWLQPCQSYAYSVFALFLRQRHARLLLPLCCLQQAVVALSFALSLDFLSWPLSATCTQPLQPGDRGECQLAGLAVKASAFTQLHPPPSEQGQHNLSLSISHSPSL